MILFIEQRHIDAGRGWSSNPRHCPIAHALNELMGYRGVFQDAYGWHVSATPSYVDIRRDDDETAVRYLPSAAAVEFMRRFDNGDTVRPCAIELHQQPAHLPPMFYRTIDGHYDLANDLDAIPPRKSTKTIEED
jgi:hypothetical protein